MAKRFLPTSRVIDGVSAMPARHRLILAEDHASMLEEIVRLLSQEFDVVCAVRHGQELLDAAEKLKPDAVVTDIDMPVLDGISACERLREQGFHGGVVLLTLHTETVLVERAFRAGASGFVLKVDAGEDLIPAVYAALEGRNFRSRGVFVRETL
jgi:DNA-binding NarL/FixJ family response regulator